MGHLWLLFLPSCSREYRFSKKSKSSIQRGCPLSLCERETQRPPEAVLVVRPAINPHRGRIGHVLGKRYLAVPTAPEHEVEYLPSSIVATVWILIDRLGISRDLKEEVSTIKLQRRRSVSGGHDCLTANESTLPDTVSRGGKTRLERRV